MITNNLTDITLCKPNILDGNQVMDMQKEFFNTHCKFNGTCDLNLYNDYIDWLAHTINQTHQTEFNHNPNSIKYTYLVTHNQQLIGIVEIIVYYDTNLLQNCAHIVECIRPSCRRKGFGKPLMKKAVQECLFLGIEKSNITYERNSKASRGTMNKITDF